MQELSFDHMNHYIGSLTMGDICKKYEVMIQKHTARELLVYHEMCVTKLAPPIQWITNSELSPRREDAGARSEDQGEHDPKQQHYSH
jgi:hypothetical protein